MSGFTAEIPPSAEGVAAVSERLAAWLEAAGVPMPVIGRVELVLEEVTMNIVMHGSPADGGQPRIRLEAALLPAGCRLTVTDNGPAFDPVTSPLVREVASIDQDRPGGLGLMLMRRYGRDLDWQPLPGSGNRLALTIPIPGPLAAG